MTNNDLLMEAKTRFQEVSSSINRKIDELNRLGMLSEIDYRMLQTDALQCGKAARETLEQSDYPPEMQRELVNRLIIQYESSANEVLAKAEERMLSTNFVESHLHHIDSSVILEMGTLARNWAQENTRTLEELHQRFIRQAKSLRRHSMISSSTIAEFYQEYEDLIRKHIENSQLENRLLHQSADRPHQSADRPHQSADIETSHHQIDVEDSKTSRWKKQKLLGFIGSLFGRKGT